MYPGLADGEYTIRWGGETWVGRAGKDVCGGCALELVEPLLPVQAGSAAGDLGAMVLAVGLLLVLGLAVVALRHSTLSDVLSGEEAEKRPSSTDSEPATPESPSVEPKVGAESAGADDDAGQQTVEKEKTDTEEVVEILEANDGRMRQAAIVEDTDWSKSKVSMVLSEMEEEGEISKLRVGRENIVSLRGNEPEAAGSPFEEE